MGHERNDGHSSKLQVLIQPNIGLDHDVRHSVVELLNLVLADEAVLAAKTRCAYWNIRGADFFMLHSLFKSQYRLLNNVSGKLAERVRMLGGFAVGSLGEFLRLSRLEEQSGDAPTALHLLADHETAIRCLREDARKCSEEYEDEGTFDLLVSILRLHEKMAWMLRSHVEVESLSGKRPATL